MRIHSGLLAMAALGCMVGAAYGSLNWGTDLNGNTLSWLEGGTAGSAVTASIDENGWLKLTTVQSIEGNSATWNINTGSVAALYGKDPGAVWGFTMTWIDSNCLTKDKDDTNVAGDKPQPYRTSPRLNLNIVQSSTGAYTAVGSAWTSSAMVVERLNSSTEKYAIEGSVRPETGEEWEHTVTVIRNADGKLTSTLTTTILGSGLDSVTQTVTSDFLGVNENFWDTMKLELRFADQGEVFTIKNFALIPEPASLGLLGLGGLMMLRRRK